MHFQNEKLGPRLEHLRPLFDGGDLVLLPISIAREIDAHLQKLPWIGQSVDSDKLIRAKTIPMSTFERVIGELRQTEFGTHTYALAFFNADDPVVGGRLYTIMENIDAIFWKAPGTRFVFGANKEDAKWVPALNHFAQYQGSDSIMVSE